MADSIEPRLGMTVFADETSPFVGVTGWNTQMALIYGKVVVARADVYANLGAPTVANVLFWATDTSRLYHSGTGASWTEVSPIGGGGNPVADRVSGPGIGPAPGTARTGSRSDHDHGSAAFPATTWKDIPGQAAVSVSAPGSYVGVSAMAGVGAGARPVRVTLNWAMFVNSGALTDEVECQIWLNGAVSRITRTYAQTANTGTWSFVLAANTTINVQWIMVKASGTSQCVCNGDGRFNWFQIQTSPIVT